MRRSHRSHSRTHLLVKYYLTQTSPRLNMLWTSVNYPDCPDLQIIQKYGRSYRFCKIIHIMLQIMQTHRSKYICICMQIIHTLSRCKDRTVHTDFHSGRPYGSCRLYRSCRSMTPSNKRVQIMQIVQALSRSRRTGQAHRTDPISVEMYWFYRSHRICSDSHLSMKIVTTQIPFTCACHGDQPDHTWLTNANDTERTCRPTQTIWRVYITDPPDHAGRSYTSCTHGTQILQLGTQVQSLRPSRYHRQIKGDTSTIYKSCRSYKSFRSCRPAH